MKRDWQAVVPIAATFFFFLLFAQFAFLEGLSEKGRGESSLTPVMAAMGAGGLAGSFLAIGLVGRLGGRRVLRLALVFCGLLAGLSLRVGSMFTGVLLALLLGLGLGIATVTLAGCLPEWTRAGRAAVVVGAGTGLAYGLCNVPAIFEAGWAAQSLMAAGAAVAGAAAVPKEGAIADAAGGSAGNGSGFFAGALGLLFFLVWLDSAAFFIIQHTPELKKETWGSAHLWRNAGTHFVAALAAGWLLDRGWMWRVLFGALAILSVAALMLNESAVAAGAGFLYPVGVSLYSVALVALPGILGGKRGRAAALRRAAWVFAIAGWMGSALGVGMGENLHRVPEWFVLIPWLLAGAGWAWKRGAGIRGALRVVPAVAAVIGAGSILAGVFGEERLVPDEAVARGREVYLSEGCIHCHSRYVRPGGWEELPWGPGVEVASLLEERPVLIGNRRQGPDLLQVGLRRSTVWLELKLRDPRGLHAESVMPAYGHLFEDGRGADLVAFLGEAREGDFEKRLKAIGTWKPVDASKGADGEEMYEPLCAGCHGAEGKGDGPLAVNFLRPPTNLVEGPFVHTLGEPGVELWLRIARIVKFGVPGTDMAGHELLEDGEALGLAQRVMGMRTRKGQ